MFRYVLCCAVADMLTPHKAYQGDTPNMVAFSTLLQAMHDFVGKHDSPPVVFYHDRQQEFGRSMQEMHEMFGKIRREDVDSGFPQDCARGL